ncbi:MAG TPA: hypothetical protein VLA56_18970 [Pseudomonadales bacterium]|nr:hypothetical protein [Pseudomonadales bacterium]
MTTPSPPIHPADREIVTAGGPPPFGTLNRTLEPLVRAGIGAPLPLPLGWQPGLVVLEVIGRRTGRTIRVPLVAAAQRSLVLVTTVRRDSQWVRNLAHMDEATIWLRGRARSGQVLAWGDARRSAPETRAARNAMRWLAPTLEVLGLRGALIDLGAVAASE